MMYAASIIKHQPTIFTVVVRPVHAGYGQDRGAVARVATPGCHFDYAALSEGYECDRTGHQHGDDRNERFKAGPCHGEIFEPLSPAHNIVTALADGIH